MPHEVSYTVTVDGRTSSASVTKAEPEPDDLVACTLDVTFGQGGSTYQLAGRSPG